MAIVDQERFRQAAEEVQNLKRALHDASSAAVALTASAARRPFLCDF
jgi:hypothetical protein